MIIILKNSEVFRDGNYSKDDAEIALAEIFADLYMNPKTRNISAMGKAEFRRVDKDLYIEDVNIVKVVIVEGK